MSVRAAAALTLGLTLAACHRPTMYLSAPGPAQQAKAALAGDPVNTDPKSKFKVGRIDKTLQPVRGKAKASSPYSTTALVYRGVRDGKMCFSFDYGAPYYRSRGTQKEAEAERAAGAKLNVFTFEVREDLDGLDSTWPDAPKSQIVSSRVIDGKLEDRVRENESGAVTHSEWLETTIEICGNSPKTTGSPRYLTATRFPSSDTGKSPTFFIWAIDEK